MKATKAKINCIKAREKSTTEKKEKAMNGKITCLVFIEVKEGRAKDQINLYKKIKSMVLAEPGCIEYKLTQVKGSETKFILIEQWTSKEALAAHDATPHMIDADSKSPAFRSKPAEIVEIVEI